MLSLSEFLGVEEGMEFTFSNETTKDTTIHKIENNRLMFKDGEVWDESSLEINDIVQWNIQKMILTDKEKEYLKAVIEPYKNLSIRILKNTIEVSIEKDREVYDEYYLLARFDTLVGLKFNGMEQDKPYTLEELGL